MHVHEKCLNRHFQNLTKINTSYNSRMNEASITYQQYDPIQGHLNNRQNATAICKNRPLNHI